MTGGVLKMNMCHKGLRVSFLRQAKTINTGIYIYIYIYIYLYQEINEDNSKKIRT